MKTYVLFICFLLLFTLCSCNKDESDPVIIPVPNGDFELWDNRPVLNTWYTNSCPECVPAFETYIVQRVPEAQNGQFAAKFIANSVYSSFATNKFSVDLHPDLLTGYIKSKITAGDTASIEIKIYSGVNIVDEGNFYETSSNGNYRKIEIPISQSSSLIDSVLIKITGGKKPNTELDVDNLVLIKN